MVYTLPSAPSPEPPVKWIRYAEHHWLLKKDIDGHSYGAVVLQWNPGAQRWSASGMVGTGIYVDVSYWEYLDHCKTPGGTYA